MNENSKLKQMHQEFVKTQATLTTMSTKKRELGIKLATIKKTLEELKKTDEEKVFQIIGNVLFHKSRNTVETELLESKDSLSSELDTMNKDWDALMEDFKKMGKALERGVRAAQGMQNSDSMNINNAPQKNSMSEIDRIMSGRY